MRRYFRDTLVESLASHPLITAEPSTTVEKAVEIMLKNKIRETKPGLALSILRTASRGKAPRCDSCNARTVVQWCDSCNRFKCLGCEDQVHSVDLP